MRKLRILEHTFPCGTTVWYVQQRRLFGWESLNKDMIGTFFAHRYKSFKEAKKAYDSVNNVKSGSKVLIGN